MPIKPYLLATVSSLALLAAPTAARASCPSVSLDDQAYTNATVICFLGTSGDVDLTNTTTGMIGTIRDTASTDTTTIDNAGTIGGNGAHAIQFQGTLTLTNRSGAIISASVDAIEGGYRYVTTIVNDGRIEGNHAIDLGGALDLTNTGVIAGSGVGIDAYAVTATNSGTISGHDFALRAIGDLTLDNSGEIVTDAAPVTNGAAVKAWGGTTVITNSGDISSGNGDGIYAEVLVRDVPVGSFTLTNTGTIGGTIGVATASNIVSTVSATIVNSGTISGYSAAISTGGDLTLDNSGTIQSVGNSGDWNGVAAHGVTTKITNSGGIDGLGVYGVGILADSTDANASLVLTNSGAINTWFGVGSQVVTTTIDNSGSITGTTAGSAISAVNAAANASLTLTNRESGTLYGEDGVSSDVATTTIDNSGAINGDVDGVLAGYAAVDASLALINSGAITGGRDGVHTLDTTSTIDNSGTITGTGGEGIFALGALANASLALTNSGAIAGVHNGVDSEVATTTIDNSGTIAGARGYGVVAFSALADASLVLINSGSVTGGFEGVDSEVATTTIDNSGTIAGAVNSGVFAFSTLANASLALTNSGAITGVRYGVSSMVATTTIDNSGTIAGDVDGVVAYDTGAGAFLALTNSGTITGKYGVDSQLATTTIDNSGIIAGISGQAYGVYAEGTAADASLALINSGSITGDIGVVSQVVTTTIDNSGTIAGATYGIETYNLAANASLALTNRGTITGSTGVYAQVAATIDNSGTIAGTGGYGVFAANAPANASLALTNSGTITNDSGIFSRFATTTIRNSGSIAGTNDIAIFALSSAAGSSLAVTNSGTITGTYGVYSFARTTTIDNSGTITGSDVGIYTNGTLALTNTGLISGGSAAVLLDNNGNSLTLGKGARFDGVVDYAGTIGNTTRFGHGSWILDVANYDDADNTIVTTAGSVYAVKGNQIFVGDASAVQAGPRSTLDITRSLSGLASDALSLSPSSLPVAGSFGGALAYADDNVFDREFTSGALTGPKQDNPLSRFSNNAASDGAGNIVWSRAFAGRSIAPQDETSAASWTNFIGGAVGGDHRFSDSLRLGGFLGLADSHTGIDGGSSLESTLYYAGLYGRWSPGAAFIEATLTAGYADNRSERQVTTGLTNETAVGKYGSVFFSPELAVGYRFALQPGVSLTPQLRARYLGIDAQGYSETGSSADLTVSSHYTGFLEERALAKLEFDNERWSLFTTLGAVALQRVQGNGTNVSLLGITSTVAEGKSSLNGASFGLGGTVKVNDAVSLFGALNGTVMTDNAASIDANAGVKVTF